MIEGGAQGGRYPWGGCPEIAAQCASERTHRGKQLTPTKQLVHSVHSVFHPGVPGAADLLHGGLGAPGGEAAVPRGGGARRGLRLDGVDGGGHPWGSARSFLGFLKP